MNVSEDYDDKIKCLNTHPDLLSRDEDMEKRLQENRKVIVKALTSKAVPHDTKATVKAIGSQVAPHGTVAPRNGIRLRVAPNNGIWPQVALKQAFQSYKKAIRSDAFTYKVFRARR